MITFDFDGMNVFEFDKKLEEIEKLFPNKKIWFNKSSSGKGYHVKVFDVENNYKLRLKLGDDTKRIECDIIRGWKGLPTNVLFTKKINFKKWLNGNQKTN